MTDKSDPKTKQKQWRQATFESEHPSYGHVNFSRITGGNHRLFGSAIRDHYCFIRLTVMPARLEHALHHDRTYATTLRPLIEVDMSAAQFAELLTSLNFGSGVPCTIRHANGKDIEDPPEIETETERIRSSFVGDLADMGAKMSEYRKRIEELTAGMPAKKQLEIRLALDVITQQLTSNVPFIADQFNEATERVTTAAKAEIEAFALHAVTTAGIQALAGRADGAEIPAAPSQQLLRGESAKDQDVEPR